MASRSSGGVRVEGLSRVLRDLKALGLEIDDLKNAFAKIADEAAQRIEAAAPKKSGRLASSTRGNRAQSKAVVRVGKAAVPYAGAINYGWAARNIAASGFIQRGEEQYTPTAITRLEEEIEAAIRRKGLTR